MKDISSTLSVGKEQVPEKAGRGVYVTSGTVVCRDASSARHSCAASPIGILKTPVATLGIGLFWG